jgi:hypothetical protein
LDTMMRFDGADYNHARDSRRLTNQLDVVLTIMRDGEWRSLGEIAELACAPEASVSAQLRHLRKPRFGGHTVNKKYIGGGLYKYQLELKKETT